MVTPSEDPSEIAEANEKVARIIVRLLRLLGDAGEPAEAGRVAGQAWAALRRVHPHAAQRINGAMHYLAKLEGEGGVGSADASAVPVLRLARVRPAEGQREALIRAARENAQDALAAGALSAEVYDDGQEGIVVASRWPTPNALEEFLSWHEARAHESLRGLAAGTPSVTHLRLAR